MAARSKGADAKRQVLTMRVTDAMAERLRSVAASNGRSLSQEIELRLELSFQADGFASIIRSALKG